MDKWFALAVAVLLLAAWLFRFDMGERSGAGYPLVLDRWTGEVKVPTQSGAVSMGYVWRGVPAEKPVTDPDTIRRLDSAK